MGNGVFIGGLIEFNLTYSLTNKAILDRMEWCMLPTITIRYIL